MFLNQNNLNQRWIVMSLETFGICSPIEEIKYKLLNLFSSLLPNILYTGI